MKTHALVPVLVVAAFLQGSEGGCGQGNPHDSEVVLDNNSTCGARAEVTVEPGWCAAIPTCDGAGSLNPRDFTISPVAGPAPGIDVKIGHDGYQLAGGRSLEELVVCVNINAVARVGETHEVRVNYTQAGASVSLPVRIKVVDTGWGVEVHETGGDESSTNTTNAPNRFEASVTGTARIFAASYTWVVYRDGQRRDDITASPLDFVGIRVEITFPEPGNFEVEVEVTETETGRKRSSRIAHVVV